MTDDPHADMPVERAGADIADASAAVVFVHGRGARATGMLDLARQFDREDVAYLAPQANRGTWYPQSFLAPIEANEPFLSAALGKLDSVLDTVTESVPLDRTILLGFSQGACLATEYAARNADRYGGVVAFSGGLIGPEGTPREYEGSMAGTSVFFGCSDVDPHIPVDRVHESTRVFEDLDGDVETRIYEGAGHTVLPDELEYARELVGSVARHE